ncbi:FadR/GntR family transcriptional regulator [Agrococcus baldri]|uniref:GntR family transcriptional regulator n=1 Tax=Agrococcus baldri TaxID=153730 RepID=A0AA87RJ07_9MICO|nr:FadR/GntR family transcriptional regulator [Agrococcus baldri]GEK80183.1 GntR family transcriptional regulator [Agrococcus baldri]
MTVSPAVRSAWSGVSTTVGDLKSDRVRILLEQQILSGELPPGTLLPREPELCEALGVSRTVLRDAVRALVAKGLLTVRQGRGTMVAEPSDEAFATAMVALLSRSTVTVGDVMDARITVETMLVRLAAAAGTDADWAELERTERALIDAIGASDDAAAHAAHAAFHAGILHATHQPALELMLGPMNKVALLTGTTSVRRGAMEDWDLGAHRAILEALRLGDADAAEQAMREHFAGLERRPVYLGLLDQPFAQAYFGAP